MSESANLNAPAGGSEWTPVPLLEEIKGHGRVWGDLASQYGVENPDPPWKTSLEGMCDVLAEGQCALPPLERRWEEDEMSESIYKDVPFPERQLLALAHSLIKRGLVSEADLASRMKQVHDRLTAS
jgi:hypothetical protein